MGIADVVAEWSHHQQCLEEIYQVIFSEDWQAGESYLLAVHWIKEHQLVIEKCEQEISYRRQHNTLPASSAIGLSPEWIAELKTRIDLPSWVERSGIELQYFGGRWKGLCPFHADTSPSFQVDEQRWWCYGCNQGGDALDFLSKKWNTPFYRTALIAAQLAHFPVPISPRQIDADWQALIRQSEQEVT